MCRKFTRWFRPRVSPSPQGFPIARAYLCTICHEVSAGRQSKCLAAHTHKIVPLASYIERYEHRIAKLWEAWLGLRRELRAAPVLPPVPRKMTSNPTLYLTRIK